MGTNSARTVTQEDASATEKLHGGSLWLLNEVLAGLRRLQPAGKKSLRGYCLADGESRDLARNSLLGTSNTKDALRLRRKLIRAAGLIEGDS